MIVCETNYSIPDSLCNTINFDLKNISVLDFSDIDGLVKIGYEQMLKQIPSIKQKSIFTKPLSEIQQKKQLYK
jgi:hypothetical protein